MCSPMAVMVAATVLSTAASYQAQQAQGRHQKGVAKYNARVAENKAQEVRRAGVEAEGIKRRETAELLSKQRAQLGAAGVELGSGSALQLQEDTVALGEIDALRIRSGTEAQAAALGTESELTLAQGEQAQAAGQQQALGTILSGTAQVASIGVSDKWLTPDSAGVQVPSNASNAQINTQFGAIA